MNPTKKIEFLCKGATVKRGEFVSASDPAGGKSTLYRIERVWGSHVVCVAVDQVDATTPCKKVSLEPDI